MACATIGAGVAVKHSKKIFLIHPVIKAKATEVAVQSEPLPQLEPARLPLVHRAPVNAVLPEIDRMNQLFSIDSEKFPIVETLSFTPKVAWLQGKLAWIGDYAAHFKTSRHFIARSLHGKPRYFDQQIASGQKFNVYKLSRPFDFHMVVDLSARQMALYYFDQTTQERVLIKTYQVGIGRADEESDKGSLTPIGTFKIGSKTAIYKAGAMGTFHNQQVEMVRVFGSRWLPLEPLEAGGINPVKGLGIYGLPLKETLEQISIDHYATDGGICLKTEDIEELYAVILTKSTFVHIVSHMDEADLPGSEVVTPTR